jgi:hypothetical protein
MPITVRCTCGKKTSVGDALAGAMIRCSACGEDVFVTAAPAQAAAPAARTRAAATQIPGRPKSKPLPAATAVPTLSINPALIIGAIVLVVLIGVVLALYLGPWTVGTKWAAMSKQANGDVTDVVDYAIKAYESEQGMYDANQSHIVPRVEGDATFLTPYMAFSMPRRIPFFGATNQGAYKGTYDTTTGEVIADIDVGGMTVGGMVSVRKASGSFHMTGREKDGKVTAEGDDGHSLKIVMRKKIKE